MSTKAFGEHVHVMDHPLVAHKLTIMRDKNTSVKDFRELVSEIGMLITYEATRDLPLTTKTVETPICTAEEPTLAGKKIAVVPILRAGLGLVDGVLRMVPSARVGHIGMFRDEETLEPHVYFCKMPKDIAERDIMIVDPMLATGGSAGAAATTSSSWSSLLLPRASSSSPKSTPMLSFTAAQSMRSSMSTATSSPASATRATASSAQNKFFCPPAAHFRPRRALHFLPCRKAGSFAGKAAFTGGILLPIIFCSEEVALYMQIEKNIAATLQRKMNAAGKTKLEFSKELGIPRSTFQEYLKGDKCLRSDSIEELAKSLSISPAQLISGPEYADARGLFSADALLAELQTLHPRAQELAKEAVSLLQTAFRISAEWDKLDTLSADPVSEVPESAYRYVLYEAHGAARMLYAYGILGQQYLSGCWTTIAITAPFSNNRSGVVRLTKLCTDQQLEPIHILDVIHDFMDLETRPF